MELTLRYFASLRERMGREKETVRPPREVKTGEGLLAWLVENDPAAQALCHPSIRLIVNAEIVPRESALSDGDEIAFCPPFSGG